MKKERARACVMCSTVWDKPVRLHELPQVPQKVLPRLLAPALGAAERRGKVLAGPSLAAPLAHRHACAEAITRNTQQEREGFSTFPSRPVAGFTEFPTQRVFWAFFAFRGRSALTSFFLPLFFFCFSEFLFFSPPSDGLFPFVRKAFTNNTPLARATRTVLG